jgi:hypothetical protein
MGMVVIGLSDEVISRYWAMDDALLQMLPYDWRTSFGLPVLPEVVSRRAKSS